MPDTSTNPGVQVRGASGSRTIVGGPTAVTAFVGRARKGPLDRPVRIWSFADYEREFGGLWAESPLSYAVAQYFRNGGREALVARVVRNGDDDAPLRESDLLPDPATAAGVYLFDREGAPAFDLLCVPPPSLTEDLGVDAWSRAVAYCAKRRAVCLVDAPATWTTVAEAEAGVATLRVVDGHAAVYFPRLLVRDPLRGDQSRAFAPCGAVAGVVARTDAERGVWKAPAGGDARLLGVEGLSVALSKPDIDRLNPLGINCLDDVPGRGPLVWGARMLAPRGSPEWRYLPVRRTALFIEESLVRGLGWAVFEPNGEPLWAAIRQAVGDFLFPLYRQGAFEGGTPAEAFLVRCDRSTMSDADVREGVVHVLVGVALTRPAEFTFVRVRLSAGRR